MLFTCLAQLSARCHSMGLAGRRAFVAAYGGGVRRGVLRRGEREGGAGVWVWVVGEFVT